MPKLIIVESPGKIPTIQKYVGRGYTVKASVGHIKDLPKKEIGVDTKKNFKPKFVINADKRDVVADLKKTAAKCSEVLIATDPDREGECIAQHLAEELKVSGDCRITFNAITKPEIQRALKNPRKIDAGKVNAQKARRVLDRLVGYKISPFLFRKVAPKTSAGRVQSAALLLIASKERDIRRFKSRQFWTVQATLNVDGETVETQVVDTKGQTKEFASKQAAQTALKEIKENAIKFVSQDSKTISRSPYAPFITSTFQQSCAASLKMSAAQAMQQAQKLYEGISIPDEGKLALITYMRTDSYRSAPEAVAAARNHVSSNYSSEYLPSRSKFYGKKKGKNQQDAHEAIRPAHLEISPDKVRDSTLRRVYDLVWRRFIASQMSDAKIEQTKLTFKAKNTILEAKGSRVTFDGFTAIYPIRIEEQELPNISKPKSVKLTKSADKEHKTQPPRRFTEAQLIKTLEKEGIGRPSTYAAIVKNIVDRNYVKKEKGSFHLTEVGLLVNDQLQEHFAGIINLKFTSNMEDSLDKIEEGEDWTKIVGSFYEDLSSDLKKANKATKLKIKTNVPCQNCKKNLVMLYGKNGRFLACEDYPKCKSARDLPDSVDVLGSIDSYGDKGITLDLKVEKGKECPECGSALSRKTSKFGPFWGCTAYKEGCKYTKNIDTPIIPCPDCDDGDIVSKGWKGKTFYACNQYPDCKTTFSHKPLEETCAECSGHLVSYKKKSVCVNKDCSKHVETNKRRFKKKKW